MRGYIRALRLDLMPLHNRLFFHSYGRTCFALILRIFLNLGVAVLFPPLPSTTTFVRLRFPLLSPILGILEEIQFSRQVATLRFLGRRRIFVRGA